MIFKLIPFMIAVQLSAAKWPVTKEDALKIPTVHQMDVDTGLKSADYIDRAVANAHWQQAMKKLRTRDRAYSVGNDHIGTFDLMGTLDELVAASEEGVLIASYQGYVITCEVSMKKGSLAKKYIPVFAGSLMNAGLCQGYIDTAFAHAHGWVDKKRDYETALSMLQKGEGACMAESTPAWQKKFWAQDKAKYTALLKERGTKR